MVYPACLVLVAQSDIPTPAAASSSGTMITQGGHHSHALHRESALSSVTLTPPTSPEEAQKGMIAVWSKKILLQAINVFG